MHNIIMNTDSYKASHWLQYPKGTEFVSSYIESRGGKWTDTVFFGLQAFLKEYMSKPITMADVDEAAEFFAAHGEPFNRDGWEYIVTEHKGKLPIRIEAVPEGTVVPTNNVLVQVVNTDPKCFWLTSYLETALLRAVWYPTTVATNSKSAKCVILKYLEKTGDPSTIAFKMHDFGARGVSSYESAGIGGAAHLVNFMGTDTVSGVLWANKYYNSGVCGFSIPASEHSTMTSWGGEPGEIGAMANMVEQFGGPGKIYAVVSDSYSTTTATIIKWRKLYKKVCEKGGTLVVRPDSGDPVVTPVNAVKYLMMWAGSTKNEKGYYVLPDNLRVIQGDGITSETIRSILSFAARERISADNFAFGQGGGLLQQVNRDTLKFAMKCSAICVNGEWRDVYKQPEGQMDKKSKKGRLSLNLYNGGYITTSIDTKWGTPQMRVVYENGDLLIDDDFDAIRQRAEAG